MFGTKYMDKQERNMLYEQFWPWVLLFMACMALFLIPIDDMPPIVRGLIVVEFLIVVLIFLFGMLRYNRVWEREIDETKDGDYYHIICYDCKYKDKKYYGVAATRKAAIHKLNNPTHRVFKGTYRIKRTGD